MSGSLHPPLLFCFNEDIGALVESVSGLSEEQIKEARRLHQCGLPPVVSLRTLAVMTGFSPSFAGAMAKRPERYYRVFSIPKGKKKRTIEAPNVALKCILRWFAYHCARSIPVLGLLGDCVFGFVPGRSPFDAAARHCESDWVYSVDIQDFFRSTPSARLIPVLMRLGYSVEASRLVASISSYKGHLPQGAPTSPVFANLVFAEVDEVLFGHAKSRGITYTRYADDLVFSGRGEMPPELPGDISAALLRFDCWRVATTKTYASSRPRRLKVHGFLVDGKVPRLTKGYRARMRTFAFVLHSGRAKNPLEEAKLRGHVAYHAYIERRRAESESG